MRYWRMQLHPGDSDRSAEYAARCLAAGFIGLDFPEDPGDLTKIRREELATTQRDFWDFAHTMSPGDWVLVIVHHFPYALTRVQGGYNYLKAEPEEMGIWFRHFRKIDETAFYADYLKDATSWERITMTDTISVLTTPDTKSRMLIDEWLAARSS